MVDAAAQLFAPAGTAGQQNADSSRQAAAQLLDAACELLHESYVLSSGGVTMPAYAELQQPAMQQVLHLLLRHPALPPLQRLRPALQAAVCTEVAAGNGSILEAAEQLTAAGRLSAEDMSQLRWAVVEGAATLAGSAKC